MLSAATVQELADGALRNRPEVALHPHCSPALRAALAKSTDAKTRMAAIATSALSADEAAVLARNADVAVRAGIASHPDAPLSVIEALIGDADESVRAAAILPAHVNAVIANDYGPKAQRLRAESCRATPALLAQRTSDPSQYVRQLVAQCPKTPPEALAQLAKDKSADVREWVARQPSTPAAVLGELAAEKLEYVSAAALSNPRTPWGAIVAKLAGPFGAKILRSAEAGKGSAETLAAHPFAPPQALALLAARALDEVAENPRTLLEDLARPPRAERAKRNGRQSRMK